MAEDGRTAEEGAYRLAMRLTVIAIVVLAVAGVAVGALVGGAAGAWSALAGVVIAGISGIVTQVAMVVGHRREPGIFAAIVAGSWLAKMLVIVVGLLGLDQVKSLDRGTFGTVMLLGVGATLAIDMFAVRRARITYTGTSSGGDRS